MTEEVKKPTFSELLETLEQINNNDTFDVWVPSLKKNVKFKPLTTKQERELIKALVDNPIYKTKFNITSLDIIEQNLCDEIDGELNMIDKTAILIQIRIHCIGDRFTTKTSRELKVDSTLEIIKKISIPPPVEIENNGIKVVCSVPTLAKEYEIETELKDQLEQVDINSYEKLREVVSNAYIGEFIKHIDSFTINGHEVDYDKLSYKEKELLVFRINSKISREIVNYIEEVKEIQSKMKTFKCVDPIGTELEVDIDSSFFTSK